MSSLEKLAENESSYQPSAAVKNALQSVSLVCIVGGVAAGKNYLMQLSGVPVVGRVTARPRRPDDNPKVYKFFTNEELIEKIERGELVQYAVDLPNRVIYGSLPSDYVQNSPSLMDTWSWSVDMLKEKGFGSVRAVSIITPWEQWKPQLDERFATRDASYRTARLEEARKSLEWTRARLGNPDHAIIINDQSHTDKSVHILKDFAQDRPVTTPEEAAPLIEQLLEKLSQEVY